MTFKVITKEEFLHWKKQISKTHDFTTKEYFDGKEIDYTIETRSGTVIALKKTQNFMYTNYYKNMDIVGDV